MVVASSRYDVLLVVPWNVANDRTTDYCRRFIKFNDYFPSIPSIERRKAGIVHGTTIGVKNVRNLLDIKGTRNYFQVYQCFHINTFEVNESKSKKAYIKHNSRPGPQKLLNTFEGVLEEELTAGLPPVRSRDHGIEVYDIEGTPYRPLFQFSPEKLAMAKTYVL